MSAILGEPASFDHYEIVDRSLYDVCFLKQLTKDKKVGLDYVQFDRSKYRRSAGSFCAYVYVKPSFYEKAKETFANLKDLSCDCDDRYYFFASSTQQSLDLLNTIVKNCNYSDKVKEIFSLLEKQMTQNLNSCDRLNLKPNLFLRSEAESGLGCNESPFL